MVSTQRLVIKKTLAEGGRYSHSVFFVGVTSSPIAYVNQTPHGFQVFDLQGNGKGLHDTRDRAKLAVIEKIIGCK